MPKNLVLLAWRKFPPPLFWYIFISDKDYSDN